MEKNLPAIDAASGRDYTAGNRNAMSDDLQRCIDEGRQAREALLKCDDPDRRGIMLWLSDQVAEECLIRLQDEHGRHDTG